MAADARHGLQPRRHRRVGGLGADGFLQPRDLRGAVRDLVEIEPGDVLHRRWQLRAPGVEFHLKDLQMRWPLRRDDAVLREMTAQGVDELRALAHQQIARPEDHGAGLLSFTLHCDEAHVGADGGLDDCFRIGGVVFVAPYERLDVDRRDQPDRVAKPDDFPAPVVRRRAGLHRHDAGRQLRQERQDLGSRELAAKQDRAIGRRGMKLKHPLRQVDADYANLRHGCSPLWVT